MTAPPTTICVVEDDAGVRDLFRLMLESRGYRCVNLPGGEDVLEEIRREKPALVVLDIALPGKSGLEVLSEIRNDSELAALPIVIVTGLTDEGPGGDAQWRRRLEVEGYFSKPLEPRKLLEALEEIIQRRQLAN